MAELASRIHVLTQVPADRQKYIGLSKVKPADNGDKPFTVLRVKDGARFTMIGTPEKDTFVDPKHMTLPDVSLGSSWEGGCWVLHNEVRVNQLMELVQAARS